MRTSLSTEDLTKLYNRGYSTGAIAKKLGMSSQGVWGRLKRHGVVMRSKRDAQKVKPRNVKGASNLTTREMAALYTNGDKTADIAKRAGISTTAVRYHLRKADISLKGCRRVKVTISIPKKHVKQAFTALSDFNVKRIL